MTPTLDTEISDTRMAICLSGGGFRAALLHLGALRRLNEVGILSKADIITSVSGGSVFSAHLASMLQKRWPESGTVISDWENLVAVPFRVFTSRDLSTGAILHRLWPWNWFRPNTGVEELARRYRKRLTDLRLVDLPERPRFVFCATDMAFAVDWVFERNRMGDYQVGYAPPRRYRLADAVAASSAFPPSFNPLPIKLRESELQGGHADQRDRATALGDLRLTDGGLYDNLGLEPVWKKPGSVLVSDGGATFSVSPDRGFFRRVFRYVGVIERQVGALRKRWLIEELKRGDRLQGVYWSIVNYCAEFVPDWKEPSYPEELVTRRIATIRTDMNAFTEAECAVLENHGYLIAAAAVDRFGPQLKTHDAEVRVPHPDWMDEDRVSDALAKSNR